MTVDTSSSPTALIRLPGEGEVILFGMTGNSLTLKAAAEETSGRISVYEATLPAAPGRLPRHLHHQTDEMWYVLEGEVTFEIAGRVQRVQTGAFVFVPRGTVHSFANRGRAQARLLTMIVPGGFEGYARETNAQTGDSDSLEELNRRYDVQAVGPPL